MRLTFIRGWAVLATAILAAAAADAGTEFAANSGWFGATLRDDQHQAVVPALLLGAAVTLSLLLFVLLARISARDPLLLRMNDLRRRLVDIVCAYCGSMLAVVAMEGYETRFGGLSPFDPRSVVLSHTLALIVAFVVIGAIVHCALRSAIRIAGRASDAVVAHFFAFLRRLLKVIAAPGALALSASEPNVVHVPLGIASRARALRAPPASIRSHSFVL